MGRSVISALDAGLQPRLRDHHRLQRHDVRRGGDPLFLRLGRGARLRGLARPRHSHLGHYRRDDDAHDDRAVVSPRPADHAADMTRLGKPDETPAPRAREHQIRLHAAAPLQLSAVGRALDLRGRDVLHGRHEFRHRLRRRHPGGTARQERRRGSRHPARQGRKPRPRAGRGAALGRAIRRDSAPQRPAGRRAGAVDRGRQAARGVRRRITNSAASMRSARASRANWCRAARSASSSRFSRC